jgi:hypothetical protein
MAIPSWGSAQAWHVGVQWSDDLGAHVLDDLTVTLTVVGESS